MTRVLNAQGRVAGKIKEKASNLPGDFLREVRATAWADPPHGPLGCAARVPSMDAYIWTPRRLDDPRGDN